MKEFPEEFLDPPGATSGDFYLSEAAKVDIHAHFYKDVYMHYHSHV